jgi:predicted DNA-binding transcriptional regulator AlpA
MPTKPASAGFFVPRGMIMPKKTFDPSSAPNPSRGITTHSELTPDAPKKTGTKSWEYMPVALRDFDQLPDSASVRLPVVKALYACSAATVWRRVKAGVIPQPKKFGEKLTAWNVGELRQALAAK